MTAARTSPAPKKPPHDMGGDRAGTIDTADHGMKFWEKQANGLRIAAVRAKLLTLDELRRAAEDLGDEYYELAYFERTTTAFRNIMLEKKYFTSAELNAKITARRQRVVPPQHTD